MTLAGWAIALASVLAIAGCDSRKSAPPPETQRPAAARPSDAKKEDWSLYTSATNAQDELIVEKGAIAAAHTDYPLVSAQLMELRRTRNTLSVKIAFHNEGVEMQKPMFIFRDVHVLDPRTGVRYGVMMEKGKYLADANPSYPDRFYKDVEPGQTIVSTMMFSAPPLEVKTVAIEIPNVGPLENLPINEQ